MASKAGAPEPLLKAYLGHTAGDVLGNHYRRIDPDELQTVSSLMDGWRTLAKGADGRNDSGTIPPPTTPGGKRHFCFALIATFLLCVDTATDFNGTG